MSRVLQFLTVAAISGAFALAQTSGTTQTRTDPNTGKPSPSVNAPQDQQSDTKKQKKHKKKKEVTDESIKSDAADPNIATGNESPHAGVTENQAKQDQKHTAPAPTQPQTDPQPNPPQN